MQSVALIDYGSGNLRSAEKALHPRRGRGRARSWSPTIPTSIAARRPDRAAGRRRLRRLHGARSRPAPGVIEAMTEAVHGKGAPFLGICVGMQLLASRGLEFGETPGLDWIARRRAAAGAGGDPAIKIPHMGWNALDGVADQPRVRAACRTGTHDLFHPLLRLLPERRGRRGGLCGARRAVPRGGGAGQCGRRAVPPGEVARPPASTCSRASWSGGRDPLPGHRPEGRPVRARGARRPGHRHGVQRPRPPTRPRAWADGRLRLAARGRPERRGRGPGGERTRRSRRSSTRSRCRCSWAAASARWPTSRRWIEAGVSRVILGTVAVRDPQIVLRGRQGLARADRRQRRRAQGQGGRAGLDRGQRPRRHHRGQALRGRRRRAP